MKRNAFIWISIFVVILLMTQVHIVLPLANALILGLPTWLWYFMTVHLILVIAIYFFSEHYMQEEKE